MAKEKSKSVLTKVSEFISGKKEVVIPKHRQDALEEAENKLKESKSVLLAARKELKRIFGA